MARLTLAERAQRIAADLTSRDLTQPLPKALSAQIARLEKQLGLKEGQFLSYAPRTRRRYLSGAKRGRTASEVRDIERAKTVARKKTKEKVIEGGMWGDPRWYRVQSLRDWLVAESMYTDKGLQTVTDRWDFDSLYTNEALKHYVRTYGFDYVIDRLENQKAAVDARLRGDASVGRTNLNRRFGTNHVRDLAASPNITIDDDERWYWYHTSPYMYGLDS